MYKNSFAKTIDKSAPIGYNKYRKSIKERRKQNVY